MRGARTNSNTQTSEKGSAKLTAGRERADTVLCPHTATPCHLNAVAVMEELRRALEANPGPGTVWQRSRSIHVHLLSTCCSPCAQVLLTQVRRSAFEAISEAEDRRGLSFTFDPADLDPDPLGTVTLTADHTIPHERAARGMGRRIIFTLYHLGVDPDMYQDSGSGRFTFGPGRYKEPDDSFQCHRR